MKKILNVIIMHNEINSGLEVMTGFVVTEEDKYYFQLQYDSSVGDYDYSNSDLTEELEEELHEKISRSTLFL